MLKLDLPQSDIRYVADFISPSAADQYFSSLLQEIPWQQDDIRVFGKTYPQPRLTSLFATNQLPYTYSNITMHPRPFSGALEEIKKRVDKYSGVAFTTCLANLYRDGKDSNGWHADDEAELGQNPVIASVSFGQERVFHLKHRNRPSLRHRIVLQHGSLLLMQGETQHHWLHQIPKSARSMSERINLTFRIIRPG